ncbi:kinase-like domain-containing protein [Rhizophagus diaphanus]|nr:kinase-like domain-containing protein [Rhizophagus diaphanus] [Rhizophagus sp. MUCL 43196]
MSAIEKQTNDFDHIGWIEKAVVNNYITYFDHTKLINKEEIVNNRIFKVNWNETGTILVVKSCGLKIEEIVNELRMQKEVDFHANILRFFGISKIDNQYSLVLEYADGGTLYSYLQKNFTKLEWDDKCHLALQLASAVECIHNKGIIHCDLHAHNVLIHKGVIKVADFGLSKKATEASNYSTEEVFGIMPYVDPRHLNSACNIKCKGQLSIMDFKSDIYSIGVLFWFLSSGRRPFSDYGIHLAMDIVNGKREKIIEGTPIKYSNLYTECWANDPNERPSIQQVVSKLKSIENNEETYSTKCTKNEIKKEPPNKDIECVVDRRHS